MTTDNTVTLQIPASTSNCGPGFDTLAIGLNLYNFLKITAVDGRQPPFGVDMPAETLEMARAAADAFAGATNLSEQPVFQFEVWGEIPSTRGLGSSGALRAGFIAGLNYLHGEPLDTESMIRLVARLDGAPDNAAAAFRGGFVVSRLDPETGAYLGSIRFPVSQNLTFVVVAPDIQVRTRDARQVLPAELPFGDAVRSLNSSSYLTAVFASGEYARLEHAVCDYIHQPYRQRLCPFVVEAIEAGVAAGAYTGWLSGSGSSVLCVSPPQASVAVAKAMGVVFSHSSIPHRLHTLKVDNQGLRRV